MLNLLIIGLLAFGFYTGARRGLVLQGVYTVGYSLSFIVAKLNYEAWAKQLELLVPYPSPSIDSHLLFFSDKILFRMDEAFYLGIAFITIQTLGWLITRFVGMVCYRLTFFPVIRQVNTGLGGLLSFLVVYTGIFLCLFVLSMIPSAGIQQLFQQSSLAQFMVKQTPYLSHQLYDWFVTAAL